MPMKTDNLDSLTSFDASPYYKPVPSTLTHNILMSDHPPQPADADDQHHMDVHDSKWEQDSSGTMMNPNATTFTPKPLTYAEKVKKSLPPPQPGKEQTMMSPAVESQNPLRQAGVSVIGKQPVAAHYFNGYGVPMPPNARASTGESLIFAGTNEFCHHATHGSIPERPHTSTPTIRVSSANGSGFMPVFSGPHFGQGGRDTPTFLNPLFKGKENVMARARTPEGHGYLREVLDRPSAKTGPKLSSHAKLRASGYTRHPGLVNYPTPPTHGAFAMPGAFPMPIMHHGMTPTHLPHFVPYFHPQPFVPFADPHLFPYGGYPGMMHHPLHPLYPPLPPSPFTPDLVVGHTRQSSRSSSKRPSRRGRSACLRVSEAIEIIPSRPSSATTPSVGAQHFYQKEASANGRVSLKQPSGLKEVCEAIPVSLQQQPVPKDEDRLPATTVMLERERPASAKISERGRSRFKFVSPSEDDIVPRSGSQSRETVYSSLTRGSGSISIHTAETSADEHHPSGIQALSEESKPLGPATQYLLGYINQAAQVGGPPPNAPTGPASLHRPSAASNGTTQISLAKPPETGTWSQSQRWVSPETKERMALQKMMQNLHYIGADKSPFVPQTPAELTAFKIQDTEAKTKRLAEDIRRRESLSQRSGDVVQRHKDKPELFGGKDILDRLSPVFAAKSCYNDDFPLEDDKQLSNKYRVDWPSLAELKEDGEKRAARYGRYFPLPRLNVVAKRVLELDQESPYNPDGTIKWGKKAVKLESHEIPPVSPAMDEGCHEIVQLKIQDLPNCLRAFLVDIGEGVSGDQENFHNKEIKEEEQVPLSLEEKQKTEHVGSRD